MGLSVLNFEHQLHRPVNEAERSYGPTIKKHTWQERVARIVSTPHFQPKGSEFESPREKKRVGAHRKGLKKKKKEAHMAQYRLVGNFKIQMLNYCVWLRNQVSRHASTKSPYVFKEQNNNNYSIEMYFRPNTANFNLNPWTRSNHLGENTKAT